jgi:hypothetical protein
MDAVSRIELFCDDKNVGRICRALIGLALEPPKVTPVINAGKTNAGLQPVSNGKLLSLFVEWLKKEKLKEINHADLKHFVTSVAGRPESAYAKLRTDAQAAHVIRKEGTGKSCRYIVTVAWKPTRKKRGK